MPYRPETTRPSPAVTRPCIANFFCLAVNHPHLLVLERKAFGKAFLHSSSSVNIIPIRFHSFENHRSQALQGRPLHRCRLQKWQGSFSG